MRTIKQFISKTNKVYFFMKDKATCRSFCQTAEAEGISFCGTPPTHKGNTDIIVLLQVSKSAMSVGQAECAITTAKRVWYVLIMKNTHLETGII